MLLERDVRYRKITWPGRFHAGRMRASIGPA
jgi:hypothetical protein